MSRPHKEWVSLCQQSATFTSQISPTQMCGPVIRPKDETLKPEGIAVNHNIVVVSSGSPLIHQTTMARFQSKGMCSNHPLNLSGQDMKLASEEVYQTDPLELVTCSYASGLDEVKSMFQSMSNVSNNIRAIIGEDTKETVNHNDNVERGTSGNGDTIAKTCSGCGVTIKIHNQINDTFCTGCLEQRQERNESNIVIFNCDICSKVFYSKITLVKHFKYHSHASNFKCNVCSRKFYKSKMLKSHFKSSHTYSTNLQCVFCKTKKQYKSLMTLLNHVHKMHDVGARVASDKDDDNMEIQYSSTSLEGANNFQSDGCNKRDNENRIVKSTDLSSEICKQMSKDKITLIESHQKRDYKKCKKQNERKDPSLCSYCGKIFSTVTLLSQHIRITHLCLKQHECKFCAKRFSTTSGLRNHVEAIHEKRKFQCTLCGGFLSSSNGLQSHMRKHANRNKEPTIKCPVCPKLFKQKKNVDRHMRSHTGETPFKCSHCPREFTLEWNLIQHERLHTGEKRYKCEKCDKAFTHNVSRKNHMKYHKDGTWEHGNEQSIDTGILQIC